MAKSNQAVQLLQTRSTLGAFLEALNGRPGDLDAWLECNNEAEVRAHVLALVKDEREKWLDANPDCYECQRPRPSDFVQDYQCGGAQWAPLYAAPPAPPDVRELVEALELMIDTHENGGWPEATVIVARAALAKHRG